MEHSRLGSTIVGYASILNPANLNHPSVPTFFKSLISRLVYLNILQPKLGDTALSQFTSFIESCVKGNPENVSSFNRIEQRIDDFYFNERKNLCDYSDFCKILELVFVLSHGQADKEKGVSLNKNLLKQNMEPLTITSR